MNRAVTVALALVVVLATTMAPAAAAPEDAFEEKVSGPVAEMDALVGFSIPSEVVTYDGDPGYFVTYESGSLDSVQSWADESDDREILDYDNASNRVLLTAPPFSVQGGLGFVSSTVAGFEFSRPAFADGLVSEGYVETVDVNLRVSYVEPERVLINESGYEPPAPDAAVPGGRFDPSGVAFNEDANRSNMRAVRSAIGADNVTETGAGITVAVIDTGANVGDGEIYGNGSSGSALRITAAKNVITNESVNVSADNPDWAVVQDGNGHGSWVTSAVGANVTDADLDGIAPDANLLVAKALDDEGAGETQDIAEAIDWAETNGADVIVMSLGSPIYSATLTTELQEAVNGSVSVAVVAAGNSRQTTRYVASPADAPVEGVVAVAATNTEDNTSSVASAYFSSVGPDPGRDLSHGATVGEGPDVGAPGMKVVAPTISKTNGLRRNASLSGTSMAAPIVAGSYAVVLERRTEWQNTTAPAEWTENTSRRLPQAGTSEVGAGLIAVDRLAGKDVTESSQASERDEDAVARDAANEAFGGNPAISFGADVTDRIRSLVGA